METVFIMVGYDYDGSDVTFVVEKYGHGIYDVVAKSIDVEVREFSTTDKYALIGYLAGLPGNFETVTIIGDREGLFNGWTVDNPTPESDDDDGEWEAGEAAAMEDVEAAAEIYG